jgi:hypothetical protein
MPPLVLVGCGILRKEVNALIAQNGWQLETQYLDSALHNNLDRLSSKLQTALEAQESAGRDTLVLYGACHPLMDAILERHATLRTCGQNCIVQLISHDLFTEELEKGAYFLLEDWALNWAHMITAAFGNNREVVREIFHSSHNYMIAIRTPCSGDFAAAAEAAAKFVDLPLRWMEADLGHLESILAETLARKRPQLADEPHD